MGLRWEGNPGDTGERKERGWPGARRVGVAGMPDIVFVFVFVFESFCICNCTWVFCNWELVGIKTTTWTGRWVEDGMGREARALASS